MPKLTVINGTIDGFVGSSKIYIGRANPRYNLKKSPLANPYHISKDGTRHTVIQKYAQWLDAEIALGMKGQYRLAFEELKCIRDRVLAGENIQLVCYCKQPGSNVECHGDVVQDRVEQLMLARVQTTEERDRLVVANVQTSKPKLGGMHLIHQDILLIQRGIIVQQVNCLRVMNAGLAKAIREKWPEVYENYQQKQWKLGDVQLVQVSDAPLYVASIAGQYGYGTDKRYTNFEALALGLRRVNTWATKQNLPLYIPAGLGSGLAGGATHKERDETWSRVQSIITAECPTAMICSNEPITEKFSVSGRLCQNQVAEPPLSYSPTFTTPQKVLTVTFTGNRTQKFRTQEQREKSIQVLSGLIDRAKERALELGDTKIRYICGMAPGVDTWAASLVLEQAKKNSGISVELVAAVPCQTFPSVWPSSHKQDYETLIRLAHQVHVVNEQPYTSPQQLHKRNEWMVAQLRGTDDLVLAVHNGSSGGTQKCIDYAVRQGKAVVVYNPQTEKFTRLGNWSAKATQAHTQQPSCKLMDYER